MQSAGPFIVRQFWRMGPRKPSISVTGTPQGWSPGWFGWLSPSSALFWLALQTAWSSGGVSVTSTKYRFKGIRPRSEVVCFPMAFLKYSQHFNFCSFVPFQRVALLESERIESKWVVVCFCVCVCVWVCVHVPWQPPCQIFNAKGRANFSLLFSVYYFLWLLNNW